MQCCLHNPNTLLPLHVRRAPSYVQYFLRRYSASAAPPPAAPSPSPLSSVGFSGAGFLGIYHLGVLHYLESKSLLSPSTTFLGSSAGSLVSASTLLGCPPTSLVPVVHDVASSASSSGPLGALTPGLSLVDVMAPFMDEAIEKETGLKGVELDQLVRDQVSGRLRVHLTSPEIVKNPINLALLGDFSTHAYMDEFNSYSQLRSGCILSSYVPIATGYMSRNKGVVKTSTEALRGARFKRLKKKNKPEFDVVDGEEWIDGGISVMWPSLDESTVVVSPVTIRHASNVVVCPKGEEGSKWARVSRDIEVEISRQNGTGAIEMIHPTNTKRYDEIFESAYEDARRAFEDGAR